MSELFVTPFPEWTEAFVEAEAEGREVELFASLLGVEVPVRPEGVCIRCYARWPSVEVPGTPRYVPSWSAWPVLCGECAVRLEAR